MKDKELSLRIVKPDSIKFENSFLLECGKQLKGFEMVYETYGKLNSEKSNAILVCHALSGHHHAAGYYEHTTIQFLERIEKFKNFYKNDKLNPYTQEHIMIDSEGYYLDLYKNKCKWNQEHDNPAPKCLRLIGNKHISMSTRK